MKLQKLTERLDKEKKKSKELRACLLKQARDADAAIAKARGDNDTASVRSTRSSASTTR